MVQITTENTCKEEILRMKPPVPEVLCVKGVSTPISGANFSNNISISHTTQQILWSLLTINLDDKSSHNSIEWSGIYLKFSSKYSTVIGKFFQIYALFEAPPFVWSDHYSLDVENSPNKFDSSHKNFF